MRKLKKGQLARSIKRFLREQKVTSREYHEELLEKTCDALTGVFNTAYDLSAPVVKTIEENLSRIHETVYSAETAAARDAEAGQAADRPASSRKKAASKKAAKKAVARKAAKKTVARKRTSARKSTTGKTPVKKTAARKTARKATRKQAKPDSSAS